MEYKIKIKTKTQHQSNILKKMVHKVFYSRKITKIGNTFTDVGFNMVPSWRTLFITRFLLVTVVFAGNNLILYIKLSYVFFSD